MTLKRAYEAGELPAAGTLTRADFAPGAGVAVARRGVEFDGAGTGDYAYTNWAPTSPADGFEMEGVAWILSVGANRPLWGRQSTNYWNIYVKADGSLALRANSVEQIVTEAGVVSAGGIYHIKVRVASFFIAIYVDGVELVSATTGYGISVSVASHCIGAAGSGTSEAHAVIWDVTFRDLASDTNTAHFPLDHLDASGKYPNTHPGSTVGDATVTGTVLPKEINAVTAGSPYAVKPVRVMASRTTAQSFASLTTIDMTADVDPYGWYDAGTDEWSIPIEGTAIVSVTGRVRGTTLGTPPAEAQMRVEHVGESRIAVQDLTMDTVNEWVPFAITFAVELSASPDNFRFDVARTSGTTLEVDDVYNVITLYPNLAS